MLLPWFYFQNVQNVERNIELYQYDDDSGDWLETTQSTQQLQFDEPAFTVSLTTIVINNEMFLGLANNITYMDNVDSTNFYKFLIINETRRKK